MIAERMIRKDVYNCFIDYTKAFDKVRHGKLFDLIQQLEMDGKDIQPLQKLYWEQSAVICIDNELRKCVPISRGVKQG